MTADSLETLTVMGELRQLRNECDVNWESLSEPGAASDFLVRTEDLKEISARIGELFSDDPRLPDLRDVAFARAVAAKTLGRSGDMESSLALNAVLSMSSASPDWVQSVRHFLENDATGRTSGHDVGRDYSTVAQGFPDAPALPREEDILGERYLDVIDDAEEPGTPSWDVQVGILKRSPFTEQNDLVWDELIAACRSNLATAKESSELSALQYCLRELLEMIADNPALASPHLRPEIIARAVELHRLNQRVMEELGDSISARFDRNTFFQSVLSRLAVDVPMSIPLSDRILIARYHLDLSPDVTNHDNIERSRYATSLAELYQRNDDHNGEIMAFLEKGACLEDMRRYAEMYEVYEQALSLSRKYGLVSGIIWSTIRLSYGHFLAEDPRTATQLLLDLDDQLNRDDISGVNEREAYAEAKVALGNLFAYAGSHDGSRRYHREAAEIFTSIGNETRAWECSQRALE